MRCTNNAHMKQLLCVICIAAVCVSGCGASQLTIDNPYNAYSYEDSYINDVQTTTTDYFFAEGLCVTTPQNVGTDKTDSHVIVGGGGFNITTGEVVYNQNIFQKLYPASTTKILTAYIIIRDCDLNQYVTVSEQAVQQASDSSVCGLKAGDVITVRDLLYGLMLSSGNDAAEALAEHHSGGTDAFALEMNKTAQALGATQTHFTNPSGLPDDNHYTTVYDMYLIFREAIKQETFVQIINTRTQQVSYTSARGENVSKTYTNGNRYINGNATMPTGFEAIGGKTGTTYEAGYCLVLLSKNPDGEEIITIVFKADCTHNLYLLTNQILSRFSK